MWISDVLLPTMCRAEHKLILSDVYFLCECNRLLIFSAYRINRNRKKETMYWSSAFSSHAVTHISARGARAP